jgi:hypothetical protein
MQKTPFYQYEGHLLLLNLSSLQSPKPFKTHYSCV